MRRRSIYDPLAPIPQPTWLVVRNSTGELLKSRQLLPQTDLRAIVAAEREARVAAGWAPTEMGRVDSGFFCSREGVRQEVRVERFDPAQQMPPGHSDPVPR